MKESIERAAEIIATGGIVIFPTDTAFGIGCRADNETAVRRLFEIRKRPENKPTPVLVDSLKMAEKWVDDIPGDVRELMNRHWPGGLTIILNSHDDRVVSQVKGGTDTLGVRMPDHEVPLSLITTVGVPILAPSANFSGENTPYLFEDLDPELVQLVDEVIPGECKSKLASTVVDCTQVPWKVVRDGAVNI